jgi:anti-sigma regulatory factor (Ser/Thr protein kinase)
MLPVASRQDGQGDVVTFAGSLAGLGQGFGQLRAILDRHPLPPGTRYRCELVFEEIVTNIIRHGYADDQEHRISVTVAIDGDRVELHFEDDGVAFDPRQPVPPRLAPPHSDRGGRGLALVRSVAERLHYERTPLQQNHLCVTVAADPNR